MDETRLLEIAREAAAAGAAELMPRFGADAEGVRAKSSPTDLVSEADLAAEAAIRRLIGDRRPWDVVIGEEGGSGGWGGSEASGRLGASDGLGAGDRGGSDALRWFVDPLDGTINFLFGLPVFAVSVACEDEAGALAGVVLDPVREECFTATRSGPAEMNGAPITSRERSDLGQVMLATGFGYDTDIRARQAEVMQAVLPRVRDIRRPGAAAIDLVWAACGRVDAFYERGLKRWDYAAGALIAVRAGLEVRELPPTDRDAHGLLAAPAGVVDELVRLVGG